MRTGEDEIPLLGEEPPNQPGEEETEPEEGPEDSLAAVLGNAEGQKLEFLEMLVENILRGHLPSPCSFTVEILPEISCAVVKFDNAGSKWRT